MKISIFLSVRRLWCSPNIFFQLQGRLQRNFKYLLVSEWSSWESYEYSRFRSFTMILNIDCETFWITFSYLFLSSFGTSSQQIDERSNTKLWHRTSLNLRNTFFVRSNKELKFGFQINSTTNFIIPLVGMGWIIDLNPDRKPFMHSKLEFLTSYWSFDLSLYNLIQSLIFIFSIVLTSMIFSQRSLKRIRHVSHGPR